MTKLDNRKIAKVLRNVMTAIEEFEYGYYTGKGKPCDPLRIVWHDLLKVIHELEKKNPAGGRGFVVVYRYLFDKVMHQSIKL